MSNWDLAKKANDVCVLSRFSHLPLLANLWTLVCQAPLSMGFSRQEYWSGLPCPPPPGKKASNPIVKTVPGMDPVEAASAQNQTSLTQRTFHNPRAQFWNCCISSSQLDKEIAFPRPCCCNIKVIYFQTKELGNVNFKAFILALTHLLETDGI